MQHLLNFTDYLIEKFKLIPVYQLTSNLQQVVYCNFIKTLVICNHLLNQVANFIYWPISEAIFYIVSKLIVHEISAVKFVN